MKAVILGAGYGSRLRPLTNEKPKPLVEIKGKPILEWQINWLKKHGIKEIVITTGYKREMIMEWVAQNQERLNVNILLKTEERPISTGGELHGLSEFLTEDFLVVNGDIMTNLNPNKLVTMSIALVPLKSPYGIVNFKGEKDIVEITTFLEKPLIESTWINAGVYRFSPEVFEFIQRDKDLERYTFPELAKRQKLKGVLFKDVIWRSIDTFKDLDEAEKEMDKLE
ncbi:MAG: nucleotidyltransferase family protein [Desulfurococcus sp.]|uniref:nucleotidyltransferase family protein n=1 Tax=Thermoprotei TaxID=183924 RepID=UPI0031653194|nr:nucleotidyltransferase family protein [Staphylococcus epidermidis]